MSSSDNQPAVFAPAPPKTKQPPPPPPKPRFAELNMASLNSITCPPSTPASGDRIDLSATSTTQEENPERVMPVGIDKYTDNGNQSGVSREYNNLEGMPSTKTENSNHSSRSSSSNRGDGQETVDLVSGESVVTEELKPSGGELQQGSHLQQQPQQKHPPMLPSYVDMNYTDGPIDDTYYNKLPHWSQNLALIENVSIADCLIAGGSDYGQMSYFTETGDIILEIDDLKVAGLPNADLEAILAQGTEHNFKIVTGQHSLPVELREYLSRSFARGSVDHRLQELIRDNIYDRTVPCTTRSMREGEVEGKDYRFMSREKFLEMDKAGLLLESGVYCGNYYGTPFPLSVDSATNLISDAIASTKSSEPKPSSENESMSYSDELTQPSTLKPVTSAASKARNAAKRRRNRSNLTAIETATLPYGWERIGDAHYGVYYIDHINKRTQYERPYEVELVKQPAGFGFTLIEIDRGLVVVKTLIQGGAAQASGVIQGGDVLISVAGVSVAGLQHSEIAHLFSRFEIGECVRLTFARGYQLPIGFTDEDYDIITLKIIKGHQGFGFTISEGHNGQKVKKILDVERCAALCQGDILLSINGLDLTTLTHLDVVEVLKQCIIDKPTEFMIKRKKFSSRTKTPTLSQPQTQPQQQQQMFTSSVSNADSASTLAANEVLLDPSVLSSVYQRAPLSEGFYQNQAQMVQAQAQLAAQHQQMQHHYNLQQSHQQQASKGMDNYGAEFDSTNGFVDDRSGSHFYQGEETENIYRVNQQQQQAQTLQLPQQQHDASDFERYNMAPMDLSSFYGGTGLGGYPPEATYKMIKSQSAPLVGNGHGSLTRPRSSTSGYLGPNAIPPPPPLSQLPPMFPLDVAADVEFEYHQVTLARTETGFGFRIIGGSEELSNVAIGSIVTAGSAYLDGTLKAGDEIVTINETNVIGASHKDVVELMAATGGMVTLLVRRKRFLNAYDVSLYRNENEGFGFVIISCGNCALIGRIIEGSPAHRCQRLHIRDRIVAVNGMDVTGLQHPEIVNKIKESCESLHLRIIPADCITVELVRGSQGYGFSIRGGAEFNGMPLFILALAPNGPASGLLAVGDEILEINDTPTTGMYHADAVRLIANSSPVAKLRVRRNTLANGLDAGNDLLSGLVAAAAAGSSGQSARADSSPSPQSIVGRQSSPMQQQQSLSRGLQQDSPQPSPLLQQRPSSKMLVFSNPNIVSY